jgi:hypothetical protein
MPGTSRWRPDAFESPGGRTDRRYEDLQWGAGVTQPVFFAPAATPWQRIGQRLGIQRKPRPFTIRNAKLGPQWTRVKRRLLPSMRRTLDTLIRTQGIGDLAQLCIVARAQGLQDRLADVTSGFYVKSEKPVDRADMARLFQFGDDRARPGNPWLARNTAQ